ncbi:MAG: winged helix-turn-helix domain-containing protein [Candidatus Thermoplasmatota archaeon]
MGEYEFLHYPPDAVQVDADRYGRLPESARRVFAAVRDDGPLTHADLRRRTGLPPRTVRFAVKRLKDEGLVDTRSSLRDCRNTYFFVSRACLDDGAIAEQRRRAEEAGRQGRLIEHV